MVEWGPEIIFASKARRPQKTKQKLVGNLNVLSTGKKNTFERYDSSGYLNFERFAILFVFVNLIIRIASDWRLGVVMPQKVCYHHAR